MVSMHHHKKAQNNQNSGLETDSKRLEMGEEDGTRREESPAVVPGRTDDGGAMQLHRPDRGSNLDLTAEDEKRRGVESRRTTV